jgi:nucleotide-binding universal stress UspA family protein
MNICVWGLPIVDKVGRVYNLANSCTESKTNSSKRLDWYKKGGFQLYNKIVVPLDGSNLAEVVLPPLEKYAGQIPEVLLVSVTEKVQGRVSEHGAFERNTDESFTPSRNNFSTAQVTPLITNTRYDVKDVPMTMGKMAKTAFDYLEKIAKGLEEKGFTVSVDVLAGNPAEEIVRFAEEQKAEVIMLASRGKSGFSHWDLGNIAEKVIRATHAVVILVKPDADFKETKSKRKGMAI